MQENKTQHYMKLRLSIIAMLLFSTIASWGKIVNVNDATQKAAAFLAKTSKASGAKGSMGGIKNVTLASATPEYFIFNSTDNTGFVIISAESETPTVLAYSNEGAFNMDKVDGPVKDFLDGYTEQIAAVRSKSAPLVKLNTEKYTETVLETAHFNQTGQYFNKNYSPIINDEVCYSGCVATAMAIVMRYHQWPQQGTGTHSYISTKYGVELSCDFSEVTFDWSKMPLYGDFNEEESDEVSKLLLNCGVAVNMDYEPKSAEGSSAFSCNIGYALRRYFYYDMCGEVKKKDMDREEWNAILRNEIDNGRIVVVSGRGNRGGHSFILDGYDENGLFRYNVGWGGTNNGFYSDGNIAQDRYTINSAQINIKPREISEDPYSDLTSDFIVASPEGNIKPGSGFTLKANNITNVSTETYSGRMAAAIFSEDGEMKAVISGQTGTGNGLQSASYYYNVNFNCSVPTNINVEPTDRVWLVSSEDNGKTWKRIGGFSKDYCTYLVSGHAKDLMPISPLMVPYQSNFMGNLAYSKMTVGENFTISVNNLINWGGQGNFNGQAAVALFDGVTGNLKHIVSSWKNVSLGTNAYNTFNFADCNVPSSMYPYNEDYLMVVTKTSSNTTPALVCWQGGSKAFLTLGEICTSLTSKKELGYKIMDYFLGKNPSSFSTSDADMNGDGTITISDANMIFNTIK